MNEKGWENNCWWIEKKKRRHKQFYKQHVKVMINF